MDFSTGADRVGLFWLLEEESVFPGSSDESFVDRLFVHHQRYVVVRLMMAEVYNEVR